MHGEIPTDAVASMARLLIQLAAANSAERTTGETSEDRHREQHARDSR
jgi:hypothetical protein